MKLAILRPEPGNAATRARAAAAGFETLRLPLFEIAARAWTHPDPAGHDALLLTSANAVRSAGPLGALAALPVVTVGDSTAAAARAAGLTVVATGDSDAAALSALLIAHGFSRVLHLAGEDRTPAPPGVTRTETVYASEPLAVPPERLALLTGTTALLHSARAARTLAALLDAAAIPRAGITVAAFSPAIAQAAGSGWSTVATAAAPTDAALLDAVRALGR
ncbi:uroporphyrinogen-III synthase [Sphingomonas immobilis]|uniref:Uroporphyrinogen-III synthase n=1 Tax=Sphingomonas immobilis TaxID=3063997 RepID=A0ABT8ZVE2_9SPHN|nr:uroporphyrinogen-III synthase [Sphingomonas sp. CA1-15]MDO7841545.1 uroporphyrinogen-III synthase [Sphingomonas sp. CA1-15]